MNNEKFKLWLSIFVDTLFLLLWCLLTWFFNQVSDSLKLDSKIDLYFNLIRIIFSLVLGLCGDLLFVFQVVIPTRPYRKGCCDYSLVAEQSKSIARER